MNLVANTAFFFLYIMRALSNNYNYDSFHAIKRNKHEFRIIFSAILEMMNLLLN